MIARTRSLFVHALGVAALGGCERIAVGPEIAGELARGRAYADSLVDAARTTPPERIPISGAIALGYLERQRLGLGSPFRLVDYALHDQRLDDSTRRHVAWSVLARTLDGDGYRVDPIALDSLTDSAVGPVSAPGRAHLALIARTVDEANDPRAGELAVRLAYRLAASEGTLRPGAPLVAAQVAALARDRAFARTDARALLQTARRYHADPLLLLPEWRSERRFRAERPSAATLPESVELEGMRFVPGLLERIRELPREAGGEHELADAPASLLGRAAVTLAAIDRASPMPPEAPVVVPLSAFRGALLGNALGPERWARARFLARSTTEEALVAEHARLLSQPEREALEHAMLASAVAMRGYAQERPWLPGDIAPTAAELGQRYGLSAVTFDDDVPPAWRPYYRAMLASALDDLARVVPALRLDGLRVHFGGERELRGTALALHDPRRRIVYLPPATSAGAIAHEIAHDLDWQAARARDGVRGDYATDLAMRADRGDFAAAVRGLTTATPSGAGASGASRRPTEVFARSVDWLVAVSLARDGRTNGYLSSVQDDLLTGYVTVSPPDVSGAAGRALVSILDDVAPLRPSTREWFLTRYGPGRALTPYDLVRRVLEAPLDTAAAATGSLPQLVAPVLRARDSALALIDADACRPASSDDERVGAAARRKLVLLAASARASGLMRRHGTVLAAEEARQWMTLAPYYAAAQPFALVSALRPTREVGLLQEAELLASLRPKGNGDGGLGSQCQALDGVPRE